MGVYVATKERTTHTHTHKKGRRGTLSTRREQRWPNVKDLPMELAASHDTVLQGAEGSGATKTEGGPRGQREL